MKRMLVLTLGLTLLSAASAGTAAAQHLSGNQAVDSERAWPVPCKKKPLPDSASDVARSRLANRLCHPVVPPNPCLRVPCDPPPEPCRVINGVVGTDLRWPCPPPPCPTPLDVVAIPGGVAGLTWWPCPIPPPPPCPIPLAGEDALTLAPCPIPPPLPCPLLVNGTNVSTWCPIPPPPCEKKVDGALAGIDYWRCPDVEPRPDPSKPRPLPEPLPLPLPAFPGVFHGKA